MASQELTEDFRGTDTSPLPDIYDDLTGQVSGPVTGLVLAGQNWTEFNESYTSATGSFRCQAAGTYLAPPAPGQARYAKLAHSGLNHTTGVTVIEARVVPGMALTGRLNSSFTQFGIDVTLAGSGTIEWDFTPIHTFTGAAPGALVTIRVELEASEVRFYVDDVLKHTKSGGVSSVSIDETWLEMPGFYTAHGRPVGVFALAMDALKIKTETVSGSILGGGGGADTTAPVMFGTIGVTFPTANSFTASYAPATDDVEVTGYEYSVDGGTYVSVGTALAFTVSGIPAGATKTLSVRAFDAAGNRSTALTSTIYMALVAIPGGVAPNKFPVGTEWDFDDFVLAGELTLSGGAYVSISGDGNTVLVSEGDYPTYTTTEYVRDGNTFEPVGPGPACTLAELDWRGVRAVSVAPYLSSGGYTGECLTFGKTESGWALVGSQIIDTFNHISTGGFDVRGQRLVVYGGWSGVIDTRQSVAYSWDSGTWREGETLSLGSSLQGRAAIASDAETVISHDIFGHRFVELSTTSGYTGYSVDITTPLYNDVVSISPSFRGLGFFALIGLNLSGAPNVLEEYRRYEYGWRMVKRTAASDLWPGVTRIERVQVSEDGTVMVAKAVAEAVSRWAWFFRKVSLLRLPAGFVPTPPTPDPEQPPGPNNEPSNLIDPATYALFWTNFNATYEVP